MRYPCTARNMTAWILYGTYSLVPTSSDSVELFVFSFCLPDLQCKAPHPMDIIPLVCPFISGCTAYDASIHVWSSSRRPAPMMWGSCLVQLTNCKTRFSLFQSCLPDLETRVQRKATAVSISGFAHCLMKRSLAVMLWNNLLFLSSMRSSFSSTSNKWDWAGVVTGVLTSSPHASIASWHWSSINISTFQPSVKRRSIPRNVCF